MLYRLKTPSIVYSKKIICVLSVLILAISGHAVVKATDYLPVRIVRVCQEFCVIFFRNLCRIFPSGDQAVHQ